ncbi:DNA gyrase subunit B [Photobacterium aquae]|uniref:DNA gyrase subunit B n=1 Tax=Photobacterium aquae TaxID=1195763 RepID=A0A0J1GWK6_9GAMM|nr:hypothetical protein [Photobacterium aquae]KLV04070.1 DNA gyrase subunit B [Photobacterium aquae]
MNRFLAVLSATALLAYPFAVYFGLHRWGIGSVAIFLAVLFALRVFVSRQTQLRELRNVALITGGAGIFLAVLGSVFKEHGWLTFYPVIVNATMLVVFASSLTQEQTLVERLARLQDPDLPPSGVRYTRKVTIVWCVFFIVNGLIALGTCFAPLTVWTWYNGMISYLLAGSLFAVEWLVRQRVQRKQINQ